MRIVVDAMGGDKAPDAIIEGAVLAAREYRDVEIILTGIEEVVYRHLSRFEDYRDLPISVVHASEVVTMEDLPGKVLRAKRKSSMKIGLDLVRDKEADAFVSAGNTGAVLAYATVILRPMKGVDRPCIAVQLPTLRGYTILVDGGANVDCKPNQLFQFGIMGHVMAKYLLDKRRPTVGLLSIGEEDGKGNEVTKATFQMLKQCHINFIGNVEAKAVYRGNADVIVCDGFTGNIVLKISQSMAEMIWEHLRNAFTANWRSKLGFLLVKPSLDAKRKAVDYSETGGAPLLGVNGVCIIAHGRSSPKALKNAINRAREIVEKKVNVHIQQDIESNLEDLGSWKRGTFWKHIKDIALGHDSENGQKPSGKEKPEPSDQEPSQSN
jgi:glycerol-3-phosphate acyltransferase PlsX